MGVLDKLDNASTRTREETLILDAALEEKWERLSRGLDQAITADEKVTVDAVDDDGQAPSLAMPATSKAIDEMEAIRDQVAASQVTFTFAPMDWTERLTLQASHPPREGNLIDLARGYNTSTFISALIKATCVKVVDAAGDESTDIPAATWDHLLGNQEANPPVKPTLTHGQVARLFAAAQQTDQGATRVPPSARYLLGVQDSGASLAQPSPGTSPRSGSAAGSPRGSRKSSTAKKAARKKAGSSAS
jgi:hypothetical protein